jgi:hypothetical protein
MKGRALQLFREFQTGATDRGDAFAVCRLILLARVVPERLTPELDDPELERRLEHAIETVRTTKGARRPEAT